MTFTDMNHGLQIIIDYSAQWPPSVLQKMNQTKSRVNRELFCFLCVFYCTLFFLLSCFSGLKKLKIK